MKTINQLKNTLAGYKKELREKYHVKQLGIFGSYVRGEETQSSDLDIMVELEEPIGLEFVTLAEELESLLGLKVDLISANAIRPRMMELIRKELVYV
ncbi:MAG: nucleotidyltransferase [Candidatus Aminicenantes bacterium]|nr:nucleotidyltransferase [Candidatus Aminicenantes bacterium]NIM77378.1 nucleotidyltransferase [Candidatus Aminicenantes bacterium]NIN21337.1 nucleotidyltransferase [Candidatus Aminicenantes bacterium]NIN45158.1 nucleotidyltransferase [Candidatus Aminicenantes bacterium]NIN87975.1 nucleotidyltransferase [Candidatus Aminicenantes bacterium]